MTDIPVQKPTVDFSIQFQLATNNETIERSVVAALRGFARDSESGKIEKTGSIVVIGDFLKHGPEIGGLIQMKPRESPVESVIDVSTKEGTDFLLKYSKQPHDGAIIVDTTGQIIGAGIYLIIDDPTLDVPDDCGTRHKAAASFSNRDDVVSVITLSEETSAVRVWKDGRPSQVFRNEGE